MKNNLPNVLAVFGIILIPVVVALLWEMIKPVDDFTYKDDFIDLTSCIDGKPIRIRPQRLDINLPYGIGITPPPSHPSSPE